MLFRKAFSLAELLIAFFVFGIIGGAVVPLLFSFFTTYEYVEQKNSCQERAQFSLCIMEPFALGAGLGMPSRSSEAFQDAFTFPSGTHSIPYANWGAVKVYSHQQCLRLVAGIPLGCGAEEEVVVEEKNTTVSLSGTLPDVGRRCMCFVFPCSRMPFYSRQVNGTSLVLQCSKAEGIHRFDEICGVYAVEFYLFGTTLYSRLYVDGVPEVQPRVGNIAGLHCEYDDQSSLLTVAVLARSEEPCFSPRHQEIIGWNFSWPSQYDPAYTHECVARSWRIRN